MNAYHGIPVIVHDVYSGANGYLASIEALEGTPFVGGDKWPVRTVFATVDLDELDHNECICNGFNQAGCPACRPQPTEEIPF